MVTYDCGIGCLRRDDSLRSRRTLKRTTTRMYYSIRVAEPREYLRQACLSRDTLPRCAIA